MMETSEKGTALAIIAAGGIAGAILGAIAAAGITYWLQKEFPPTYYLKMLPEERELSLSSVRKGYPPFIYKLVHSGVRLGQRRGFLGLVKVPNLWLYEVALANLTHVDQECVEVTIVYKGEASAILVAPRCPDLRLGPKEILPMGRWTPARRDDETSPFTLQVVRLKSLRASHFLLGIHSDERPSIDAIKITMSCPEGKFVRLSPMAWDSLGWRTEGKDE